MSMRAEQVLVPDGRPDERNAVTKEFLCPDRTPSVREDWALVLLWSSREPQRVGEVALLSEHKEGWVLGRCPAPSESESADPRSAKSERPVRFFQQRPAGLKDGVARGSEFVLGERISRRQLRLWSTASGIQVENIGRCPLLINGKEVSSGLAEQGALIHLREQLLLYCTRRPRRLSPLICYPEGMTCAFGEADAFGIVGESPVIWALRERLAVLARGNAHILITGESGAGKELAARTIHGLSPRADRHLVSTNIAAITPTLAPAQLFGTPKDFPQKGMSERKGIIGAADGSTLFLDEIGDMPQEVQPAFLRVLDDHHEYHRVGEEDKRPLRSDFRLIGATNRQEQMRPELLRRFTKTILVPSLDLRREDIPLLVRHILKECKRKGDLEAERFFMNGEPQFSARLLEYLVRHPYQTHVSEITTLLGHAMAESPGSVIEPCAAWTARDGEAATARTASGHTPVLSSSGSQANPIRSSSGNPLAAPSSKPQIALAPMGLAHAQVETVPNLTSPTSLAPRESLITLIAARARLKLLTEQERQSLRSMIEQTYQACAGDFSRTAELLGVTRYQLYRFLHRLGWKPVRFLELDEPRQA